MTSSRWWNGCARAASKCTCKWMRRCWNIVMLVVNWAALVSLSRYVRIITRTPHEHTNTYVHTTHTHTRTAHSHNTTHSHNTRTHNTHAHTHAHMHMYPLPHAHGHAQVRYHWLCGITLATETQISFFAFFQEEIPEQSHRAAQRGIQTLFPHAGSRWLAVCACTIINFIFFITMCLNSFALSSNRLFCLFSCEYLNFFPLRVLTQSFTVRMSVLFSFSLIIALFSCTYPIFLSGAMLTWSSVL